MEHPTVTDVVGKVSQKKEISWSNDEDEASLGNSWAFNAIFNGVDQNVFKLINICTSTKES